MCAASNSSSQISSWQEMGRRERRRFQRVGFPDRGSDPHLDAGPGGSEALVVVLHAQIEHLKLVIAILSGYFYSGEGGRRFIHPTPDESLAYAPPKSD